MANLSNINNKFIVEDSGDVGIGVTAATSKLHLRDPGVNSDVGIKIGNDSRDWNLQVMGSVSDSFQIFTHDNSNVMTILPSGNVGIGTDSPNQKITIGFADNGTDGISFRSTTYASLGKILCENDNASTNGNLQFYTRSGGDVLERMRINSSGNVGIGVTPFTNSLTNAVGVDLKNNVGLIGYANAMYISSNAYYNSGWKYRATNTAALLQVGSTDGTLTFRQAASGTADASISFEERFKIDSSGIVQINTNVAKTSTGTAEFASFGQSNEATNYSTLQMYTKGGASQADRSVIFQTIESGVANAGNIVLQPSGGNVGINANDPVKTLDVRGSLAISNSAASYWYIDRNDTTGNFDLNEQINGTLFTVDTNGKVGIGVTGPVGKIHVGLPAYTNEDTNSQQAIFGASNGYGVRIGYNETDNKGYINVLKPGIAWGSLILQEDIGNVGIGTTSPGQQLTLSNSSSSKIQIKGHSASNGLFLGMDSAVNAQLWNAENGYIRFATNDTEKMRITSGGNVNISTASGTLAQTSYKLRVESDPGVTNGIYLSAASGNDSALYVENQFGTAELFLVRGDGNIKIPQIGVTTGATAVGVDSSGFIRKLSSSKRYKKDIESIDIGLDFIDSLSPVKFKMKEDDVESVGLIAEDMIDNRFVTYSQIDMKDKSKGLQVEGVNYQALIAPLIKSIQELKAEIELLKNK